MGPEELFAALAYLATNEKGELRDTALSSLGEMPQGVVEGVVGSASDTGLLDFALRRYVEEPALAERILLNATTSDASVEWAAKRVRGRLIEIIANNQERISRHARIVEAIYYNPEAPMAVVARVFETGVRSGLDLHHIPGFREIYESIFGRDAVRKAEERAKAEPVAQQPSGPVRDELDLDGVRETLNIVVDDLPEDLPEMGFGLEEDDYLQALLAAATEEDDREEEEDQLAQKPLHKQIAEMNVPQKVRMALMGNKGARAVLVKDPKAVVALAVLKATGLREEEVVAFSKDKMISDRVVAAICRNRKWVRNKEIQSSLLKHPKTPLAFTNRWVRGLSDKDLKAMARSRDVPGHVARLARNLVSQRAQIKSKKG